MSDELQGAVAQPQNVNEHKVSAKFSALDLAIQHCRTQVEADADAVVQTAEKFWQWLVKEIA